MKRALIVAAALLATAIAGSASADTYTYNGSGGAIADLGTFSNTLSVPDTFSITDVNITLNGLSHSFLGDLEIFLGNGSDEVMLFNRNVGGVQANGAYTFDDEAAASVAAIGATGGSFRPFQLLSKFDGANSAGPWTLRISDVAALDSGNLGSWTLSLTTAVPEPATWGMMILGFGGVGATMRTVRRRAANAA